mmetsp:Transcript_10663/g.31735  ORF Transcript_10663/g.31735 Transcript_10663/m.31735 type:complete len:361 (+) Transcript_10663:67-1149(+)
MSGGGDSDDGSKTEIKPFLLKAYALVEDPETDPIISWNAAGDCFVVHNPEAFANQVLPQNFKHNNFSSFIRQLNTYGFRKVETHKWAFGHDHFRRGHQGELALIQRKRGTSGRARSRGGADAEDDEQVPVMTLAQHMPLNLAFAPPGQPATVRGMPAAGAAGAGATRPNQAPTNGGQEAGPQHTAGAVLNEIIRLSHQQSEMLQEVKALQSALKDTKDSQQLTRATITKVVGFLQHMHGGAAGHGAGAPMLLHGPGVPTDVFGNVPHKRQRLTFTDEERADADVTPPHSIDDSGAKRVAPNPPSLGRQGSLGDMLSPATLEQSRKLSEELDTSDLSDIDLTSVLDLLGDVEQQALAASAS